MDIIYFSLLIGLSYCVPKLSKMKISLTELNYIRNGLNPCLKLSSRVISLKNR